MATEVVFTATNGQNIRHTSNEDGTITVEHLDVGRNPGPPITLFIVPSTSVSTLVDFYANLTA